MVLPHWKRQFWLTKLKTAGVGRPRVKTGFETTLKVRPALKLQAFILSLDTTTEGIVYERKHYNAAPA